QVFNSTGQKVRYLFSGPESREIDLDAYKSAGVRPSDRIILPAGRYDIVVISSGTDATGRPVEGDKNAQGKPAGPPWASWPLASGVQYSFNFHGAGGDLEKSITEFEAPKTDLNIDVPNIEVPEVEVPPPSGLPPAPRGGGGGGGGRRGGGG